jgi:dipeptidyl aminopeptidase/acylaminoacyl peptidase
MQAIRLLLILGLMGVATPSFSAEFKTMRLADRTRINYAIALPPGFDPTVAYPLLLALPPGRQDDRMVLAGLDSYWEQAAAQLGYIVVNPVAPRLLFFRGSERFIPEFLQQIRRDMKFAGPVHLAGVSNGGLSAFRIAGYTRRYSRP